MKILECSGIVIVFWTPEFSFCYKRSNRKHSASKICYAPPPTPVSPLPSDASSCPMVAWDQRQLRKRVREQTLWQYWFPSTQVGRGRAGRGKMLCYSCWPCPSETWNLVARRTLRKPPSLKFSTLITLIPLTSTGKCDNFMLTSS